MQRMHCILLQWPLNEKRIFQGGVLAHKLSIRVVTMKKLVAFYAKCRSPGLLLSGYSFAAVAPSHRKRLFCFPESARVFHTSSRPSAAITASSPLAFSPSSSYSSLLSTKTFGGHSLSPLAPSSFPFTKFSSSPPIRSRCCDSRLCITLQTFAACSSVSFHSKLSSSVPSPRPSPSSTSHSSRRSSSLSKSQTIASHTLHHLLYGPPSDTRALPYPFSPMLIKLFTGNTAATAPLVWQRFCAGNASVPVTTRSSSYPCYPFEARDGRGAFRGAVLSVSSPTNYMCAENSGEMSLRAVRRAHSVAFSPVTAYLRAAAGFSSAAAVGMRCPDDATVLRGTVLPGEGELTTAATSGALSGSCSCIPAGRLLRHHFFWCAVSCNASAATRRALEKRNRVAKTTVPREARVGVRSFRDGSASDIVGDLLIAGKTYERMCFHSAAAGPATASSSSLPRPEAAPVGKKEAATRASPAAAAGVSSCPGFSSASSSSASESRNQQPILSDVPFTKKRDMNLKAGPYRRGRIFISPREDPLEFILSCIVVFVMLYTLYKLPRGEYLWERRKRVIRERLLKEYGLSEEDLEDMNNE